ncbi:MAG: hypothetical protein R2911_39670 [Caldilineaceae bacterium]
MTTGVGAAMNTRRRRSSRAAKLAIIGTGGVGLNAVQGAAIAGASQIIAVDLEDRKLELASSFSSHRCGQP